MSECSHDVSHHKQNNGGQVVEEEVRVVGTGANNYDGRFAKSSDVVSFCRLDLRVPTPAQSTTLRL